MFKYRHDSCLEILLRHVLNDVVAIGQRLWIPPVAVTCVLIHHSDHNRALLHLYFLIVVLSVGQHHLHTHGHVFLELLGDQVDFDALGQSLQQFPLEIVLLFIVFFDLELVVSQLLFLLFNFLLKLKSLLLSYLSLYFYLLFFFNLFSVLSKFFAFLEFLLQFDKLLLLLPDTCLCFFF